MIKRRTKVDDKKTDGDEESQTTSPGKEAAPSSSPAPTSLGAPAPPGANPVSVMLRKVMLLTKSDVEDNTNMGFLLTIIKDVIAGTLLGVFLLMILIFLDYRNIVQLGSARAFRRAAFELMTDPEFVKNIEESAEIKFIPADVFTSMEEEIKRNQDKVGNNEMMKQHEDNLVKNKAAIESMQKELQELKMKGDTVLGLGRWCGKCKGPWGNCDARIRYIGDTYHTAEATAKFEVMENGQCLLPN